MFARPEYGWVSFKIGSFADRASYLTDIHFDILDAILCAKKTHSPIVFKMDAEGWENIVVIDTCEVYIINNEKETSRLFSFDIGEKDIIKEIISDISKNIDSWAEWDCQPVTVFRTNERKDALLRKIEEVKRVYSF